MEIFYVINALVADTPWYFMACVPFWGTERVKKKTVFFPGICLLMLRAAGRYFITAFTDDWASWDLALVCVQSLLIPAALTAVFKTHLINLFYAFLLMFSFASFTNFLISILIIPFKQEGVIAAAVPQFTAACVIVLPLAFMFAYKFSRGLLRRAVTEMSPRVIRTLCITPAMFFLLLFINSFFIAHLDAAHVFAVNLFRIIVLITGVAAYRLNVRMILGAARRMQAEKNFTADKAALDNLNRMKTEFLGNISHELKAPLAVISSHAQMMRKREEMKECPDDYIITKSLLAVSEVERLAAMVNRLSGITRIEESQMEIRMGESDLLCVIRGAMEMYYPILTKNRNAVKLELPETFPAVYCDKERVGQILLNLISNAARFTRHGVITVSLRPENNRAVITVTDTGKGIEKKNLAFVFDRYYSDESGTCSGGTGLGLFISKKLVEAQGGNIGISSETGKGTAVTFTLPLAL